MLVKTSIALDDVLVKVAKHRAVDENLSLSKLIQKSLEEYLARVKKD